MDRSIPAEIWFDAFCNVERDELISLYRTSRSFHRISRPLLLAHFAFHPYAASKVNRWDDLSFHYLLPDEAHIKRTIRRLNFRGSGDVAPLVKECAVSPWDCERRASEEIGKYTPCDDGDILLCAFFDLLPRFTNLARINFTYVEFKQASIDALGSLPNLEEVGLERCSFAQNVTPSIALKVVRFSCFSHFYQYRPFIGVEKWIPILDTQMLTHLSIFPASMAMDFLDIAPSTAFPNVQSLTIGIHSWTPREMASLQRFPAVRILRIRQLSLQEPPPAPPTSLFPLLETYHGPPELLALIDPRAVLRRLEIDRSTPPRLESIAQSYGQILSSVTTLHLSFRCLRISVFRPLMQFFTALVHLRMAFPWIPLLSQSGELHTTQSLYLNLAEGSPFPHGLQSIAIVWRVQSASGPAGAEVTLAARAARATLAMAHPGLRWVHFGWSGVRCVWSTKEDGEVHEQIDELERGYFVHVLMLCLTSAHSSPIVLDD